MNFKNLSTDEAKVRLSRDGLNEISRKKPKSKLDIILEIIKDPIIVIMEVALVVSFLTSLDNNHFEESYVIGFLIIINILINFVQSVKTEQKLNALNKLNEEYVTVIRDDKEQNILANQLVCDDIVKLKLGVIARADVKLLTSNSIFVDESFLTGESIDVEKLAGDIVYSNSPLKNGTGFGRVIATGMNTKIGKIASTVDNVSTVKSQLEIKILQISKFLLKVSIFIAILIATLSYLNGYQFDQIFSLTISILIATVPEGLATVLAIVLTFMSQQMANNKALIKNVKLLETLGEVTYVCSDKTGTITENNMVVTNVYNISSTPLTDSIEKTIIDTETPTSKAIFTYLDSIETTINLSVIDKIPFNSTIKKAIFLLTDGQTNYLAVVGAPDFLLSNAANTIPSLTTFAQLGLRTILTSYQITTLTNLQNFDLENAMDLNPITLFGIQDPPKASAIEAINAMHEAGIEVIMITGDNIDTATAIAKQAGIITSDHDIALSGDQLNNLTDQEFVEIVPKVKVYGRVKPEDKYRIVSALQSRGNIVAMTGDGTNDSIALKKANVGIAMGIAGTDISKEAADLILLDDNFSTINNAISGGRLIFDNLLKFIRQMLTSNTAHTSTILIALIYGLFFSADPVTLPMSAILILWVNVVSDAIPCLALGLDTPDSDLMKKKPIDPDLKLLSKSTIIEILIRGFAIGFLVFVAFNYTLFTTKDSQYATTVAFLTLSFGQLFHIFDARSPKTLFKINMFNNKLIWIAVILSAALNLLVVYSPLNTLFGLVPVSPIVLITIIIVSSSLTLVLSAFKLLILKVNKK